MADRGIGSDQHAVLTKYYGDQLDKLGEVVQDVLNAVTHATSTGIIGAFSSAWGDVTHDVTAKGKKTQAVLKQVQDLLDTGRKGYVATETTSTTGIKHTNLV
ncbi:hypothetical protein ABIA39_001093 [Nocardia sp. GAS34]|uniref:hypothetical protein n=1 Tax=unclassified Nocardia TaxID=2637762 RepID=UPI003D19C0B4